MPNVESSDDSPAFWPSENIIEYLNWIFDRSREDGLLGLSSAEQLANEYMTYYDGIEEAIDALINWQVAQASSAGFISGLGGVLTLPISLPANIVAVLYLQLRMIAAIAYMRGYDPKSDKVRTFAMLCLVGSSASDILKGAGVVVGKKLTLIAIQKISGATLIKINKSIGIRLFTKFGQTGIINFSKFVPVVGGIVSGAFDGASTMATGRAAKDIFNLISKEPNDDASE